MFAAIDMEPSLDILPALPTLDLLAAVKARPLVATLVLIILYSVLTHLSSPSRKLTTKSIFYPYPLEFFDFLLNGRRRLAEAYTKNVEKSGSFHIPFGGKEMVVVTGKLVDELRLAPPEKLSFHYAMIAFFQTPYTFGPSFAYDFHHINILRAQLPRNLNFIIPEAVDELVHAFEVLLDIKPDQGWVKVKMRPTLLRMVSMISNRIFFGAPTCRTDEVRDLQVDFTMQVVAATLKINCFPKFLHPIVGPMFSPAKKAVKTMSKYIGPLMAERQHMDPASRPNDALTWLMNYVDATGPLPVNEMSLRMLAAGFVSIHTAGAGVTHAVFHIAAGRLKYVEPLREEAEAAVSKHGWTKAAAQEMKKLESFLREVMRWSGIGATVMERQAMEDFTYSDGTFVPKGHYTCTVSDAAHHDPNTYANPSEFDGWRFLQEPNASFSGTSNSYLPFGNGPGSCPGRFFAGYELKFIVAYLILHYDVRMEKEGVRPKDFWIGIDCTPNLGAEVLIRKREEYAT